VSETVTNFLTSGAPPVSTSTPAISAGGTVSVQVSIPRQCTGACKFEIKVDGPDSIEEIDEANNTLAGQCLPLPG
jgi:hypothetical protein